jgi:hypothetical protein
MKNMMKIVVSALLLLLAGCKVQENATTDRTSASTHIGRVLADSVAVKDSIVIRERCDTVFFTKYRTLYKERVRTDTVIKCDTVYAERLVTVKEKEKNNALWWLILPVIAALCKVGLFDVLRNMIMKKQ